MLSLSLIYTSIQNKIRVKHQSQSENQEESVIKSIAQAKMQTSESFPTKK